MARTRSSDARESRTSPVREASYRASTVAPSMSRIRCQSAFTLTRSPHPTLYASPNAAGGASHASRLARTTFRTNVKSRVCSPSPKIVGDSPACAHTMNLGITAAYCDAGSWRGPNTLKYRSAIVPTPNDAWNARQYCSPAYFAAAYGDSGRGSISSRLGSSAVLPYAEDDAAYTTRFTRASRAAMSTLSVPVVLAS